MSLSRLFSFRAHAMASRAVVECCQAINIIITYGCILMTKNCMSSGHDTCLELTTMLVKQEKLETRLLCLSFTTLNLMCRFLRFGHTTFISNQSLQALRHIWFPAFASNQQLSHWFSKHTKGFIWAFHLLFQVPRAVGVEYICKCLHCAGKCFASVGHNQHLEELQTSSVDT